MKTKKWSSRSQKCAGRGGGEGGEEEEQDRDGGGDRLEPGVGDDIRTMGPSSKWHD